jgi:PBP1b-binding outer membrane lipoprotein LpoB
MKKLVSVILLILILVLSSCSSGNSLQNQKEEEVIEKFKNERDTIGTGKFIEDAYDSYNDSIIISAIYHYYSALETYEFSQNKIAGFSSQVRFCV